MISKLKTKRGSMTIGWLLIISILIVFFLFSLETALLFIEKEQLQNLVDNVAYAAVLEINEEKLINGDIQIHENNAYISSERVFNERYLGERVSDIPYHELYILNQEGDKVLIEGVEFFYKENPFVIFYLKEKSSKHFTFFKNVDITVVGIAQVSSPIDLKDKDLSHIEIKDIYNEVLRFEGR